MKYTLSVLVKDQPGVLSKVSGLFSCRTFNIDSLAVGVAEDPAISRMTIVVNGDEYVMERVEKQLNELIPAVKVKCLDNTGPFISCELALIRVSCMPRYRLEITQIAELFRARVVDVSLTSLTIQSADTVGKIETMPTLPRPYGIKGITHTGTVALEQGPQVTREQSVRVDLANET